MVTLDNVFITAIQWLIDLVKEISTWWSDISEPVLTIGDTDVSLLGLFSIGLLITILIFKIVDLVIPL